MTITNCRFEDDSSVLYVDHPYVEVRLANILIESSVFSENSNFAVENSIKVLELDVQFEID
jgi:hypothetical protein